VPLTDPASGQDEVKESGASRGDEGV
jgi:hypothetical protein